MNALFPYSVNTLRIVSAYKDGKVTKKNVVSLDRNLGTNYTDKKHNGDEKVTVSTGTTGLVLGGYAEDEAGNKNNPEVTYLCNS